MIMLRENHPELEVILDEGAFMPIRAHAPDAGLDLLSPVDATVPAGGSVVIDTGVHVNLPAVEIGGFFVWSAGLLTSKSGLNVKHGIISDGTIDCEYTGSIRVKLYNLSDADYDICRGDKITQLVILPILTPEPVKVDEFSGSSERGTGGFGSTGR